MTEKLSIMHVTLFRKNLGQRKTRREEKEHFLKFKNTGSQVYRSFTTYIYVIELLMCIFTQTIDSIYHTSATNIKA